MRCTTRSSSTSRRCARSRPRSTTPRRSSRGVPRSAIERAAIPRPRRPTHTIALGILGGTFDPIHYGHLELARELRAALASGDGALVPAGRPAASRGTGRLRRASARDGRAGASPSIPGLEVDRREIDRPGPSYTVPTLESLRARIAARPLALIVGADAFLGLPQWHRWRELFDLAHIVVVGAPGDRRSTAHCAPALVPEWTRRHARDPQALLRAGPAARSSCSRSRRTTFRRPRSVPSWRAGPRGSPPYAVCFRRAVLAYIDRNQLYRPRPDAT